MESLKIQPMRVKPLEKETKTASGLYIPESAKEKPQTGTVVAVGDDEDIKLKVDDKVLFTKYTGTEFKLENEEYLLMDCSDILARLLN